MRIVSVREGPLAITMPDGDVNARALRAKKDKMVLGRLIRDEENFILACASRGAHRQVSRHDDEWSVALLAFSRAVKHYDASRGSFKAFAAIVIRNDIVNHLRAESRHATREIPATDQWLDTLPNETSTAEASSTTSAFEQSANLVEEVKKVVGFLDHYEINFADLIACSPKENRTRESCAKAVRWMLERPDVIERMRRSKRLPIRELVTNTDISRKTAERHRRYIVAVTEILSHDLPGIAAYLRFIGAKR